MPPRSWMLFMRELLAQGPSAISRPRRCAASRRPRADAVLQRRGHVRGVAEPPGLWSVERAGSRTRAEEETMSIHIETPSGVDALTEFVTFHDAVYEGHSARWAAFVPLELPILTGESPFARGRRI